MNFLNLIPKDYEIEERISIKQEFMAEKEAIYSTITDKQYAVINDLFKQHFDINIHELKEKDIIELIEFWS